MPNVDFDPRAFLDDGESDIDTPGLLAQKATQSPVIVPTIVPKSDGAMDIRPVEESPVPQPKLASNNAEPFDPQTFISAPIENTQSSFDPKAFLADTSETSQFDPAAFVSGLDQPNPAAHQEMPGISGHIQSAIDSADAAIMGGIGSAIGYGGKLISLFNPNIDQNDDASNPYMQAGLALKNKAQTYVTDPRYAGLNKAAGVAGGILPLLVVAPSLPLLGVTAALQGAGGVYDEALAKGATNENALLAGGAGGAITGIASMALGPLGGKLAGEVPTVASATWAQLGKSLAWGGLRSASKTYWDMALQNIGTQEAVNAAVPDASKQSQYDLIKDQLAESEWASPLGAITRGLDQATAEFNVSQVARKAGQEKASFITDTAQKIDDISNDTNLTPDQKVAAVSGFMGQFSPQAQKIITAHVQNVKEAIDSINASKVEMDRLSATNPMTADALGQEQHQGILQSMTQNAAIIDAQADADEQKAFAGLKPQEKQPIKETTEPVALNPELPKIQSATDGQLNENLANAQKWLADEDSKKNPEETQFWQGAVDSIQAEQARRAQPEPDHAIHYDEYGNAYKVPIEVSKAANEAAIDHPETEPLNVQAQTEKPTEPDIVQPASNPETSQEQAVEPKPITEPGGMSKIEETPGMAEPYQPPETQGPRPLEGLDLPSLVKVAQKEGHLSEDIQGARAAPVLRDLIATKRIGLSPLARNVKFESDGRALVDPRLKQLPAKYQKATQAFIDSAKKWGLRGLTKFVVDTRPEGGQSSAFVRVRDGHFDAVYINPINLVRDAAYAKARGQKAADIEHLHQLIFGEEFTHAQAARVLQKEWEQSGKPGDFSDYYDKRFQAIHDEMTAKQRADTIKKYGVDLQPSQIGEEYFRQVIQRRSGKGVTEDAIARVRKNKPLKTIVQSVVNRLKGIAEQLTSRGKPDSQLELLIHDYQKLIGSKETRNEPGKQEEGRSLNATGSALLRDKKAQHDAYDDYFGDLPSEIPAPQLRPFLTPGEKALEVASRPNEEGSVSDQANERETRLSDQIEALKHVEVPQEEQSRLQEMAQNLSKLHFGADAKNRDIAEGNAFVKALIESKKWIDQNGSLEARNEQGNAFSARKVIQNSLLDDGRRQAKQGQLVESASPETEKTPQASVDEEGNVVEVPEQPKGYDVSNQDYEAQQATFEPTEEQGIEGQISETPRSKAQSAIVDKNIKDVTGQISPYGKRLLELWNDYPDNWDSRAQKEFGITKAQANQDFEEIKSRLADEVNQRGLTSEDFNRTTGSASLRPERFAERVSQDERTPDDIRKAVFGRTYAEIPMSFSVRDAVAAVEKDGLEKSYQRVLDPNQNTSELNEEQRVTMGHVVERKFVQAGGLENLNKAIKIFETLSSYGTKLGQAVQRFRLLNDLGPDGVVLKYGQIVKPSIDIARKPFEEDISKIKGGLDQIRDETVNEIGNRPNSKALIDAYEAQSAQNDSIPETPNEENILRDTKQRLESSDLLNDIATNTKDSRTLLRQYQDATAEALSKLTGEGKSTPMLKGAFEEFGARMEKNLKGLITEDRTEAPIAQKPKISGESTLREIFQNEPSYRQAWELSKKYIQDKYADDPQMLGAFEDMLGKAFDAPLKVYDKALKEHIKFQGDSLIKIVKKWGNKTPDGRDVLVKSLVEKLGISGDAAKRVSSKLTDRLDSMISEARSKEAIRIEKINSAKQARMEARRLQEKPIWQRYQDATFKTLASLVRPDIKSREKGALEEFSGRFGQALKSLTSEGLPSSTRSKSKTFGTENTIREIYNNLPEYQKSWDAAKQFIADKYAKDPEFLKSIDGLLNKAFDVPSKFTNKLLTENIKSQGVDLKSLVKEWAGTQGATRDQLIKDIQDKMGLSPEHSELLGNALSSRFNAILEKTRQTQLAALVKRLGKSRLQNQATSIARKIIEASNLGATDDEAAYNAIADAYGLPKFDPKIAADLKSRANEIQKMIADGKEGFQSDRKTQEMLNVLANEEDKNKSYWKQAGNGALAVYYGNILGPTTLIRKTISEVGNAIGEIGSMSLAEMRYDRLALPRSIMAFGRGLYDRGGVDARNILLAGHGLRQGEADYTHAGRAFERGRPLGDIPVVNLANKPLSVFYHYVGRSLEAGASFFYAGANEARANMLAYRLAKEDERNGSIPQESSINQRMAEILGNTPELRSKFEQQAKDEGLTGRDAKLRTAELIENTRPDDLRKQAADFALRARFGQEPEGMLGEMSRRILGLTNKYPILKVLVPFTRVPANVLNTTLDYTPWGYRRAYAWDSIRGNNDRFYQQLIKATGGTIATTALAALFAQNADDKDPTLMVSADGPADFNKKQQLMQQGWVPYSIKIGDHYIGYREWPIGLGLATLGKYFDSHRYGNFKSDDAATRWAFTGLSLANELVSRSWMSNVNDFLDIVKNNNPDRAQQAFEQFGGRTAGSFIPFNQSAVRILDKMWDPNHYNAKTLAGIMSSQVPIARSMNQSAVNALGDVVQERPFMAFTGTKTEDPTWQALADKGVWIPAIANNQYLGDRTMTQAEHYQYALKSGQAIRQALEDGGLDKMAGMDTEQAQDYLNALVKVSREPVKAELRQEALDAGTILSASRRNR